MKTPEVTRARAQAWITRHLIDQVVKGTDDGMTIALSSPTGVSLRTQLPDVREWAMTWRRTEPQLPPQAHITWARRRLGQSVQELPTHLRLTTLAATAAWAGSEAESRVTRTRSRWRHLASSFPTTASAGILRAISEWDDTDVQLLTTSAAWFGRHPTSDDTWTPRQVPIPGLHAKWLDQAGRRNLIALLVDAPRVTFRNRPLQARVTYLDPRHAASGRRRWDIITAGDVLDLPYSPRTLIIVENRDTAFYFPPVIYGGLAMLGNGDAVVNLITAVTPLAGVDTIYWGDIDAAGLRIVARLRSRGHHVRTILMDLATYDAYERFGTSTDERGRPLAAGNSTPPPELTPDEAALYLRVTDPMWQGHRRIEQERIPLNNAVTALEVAIGTVPDA